MTNQKVLYLIAAVVTLTDTTRVGGVFSFHKNDSGTMEQWITFDNETPLQELIDWVENLSIGCTYEHLNKYSFYIRVFEERDYLAFSLKFL